MNEPVDRLDFRALGQTWRAGPPLDVANLRRRVERKRRFMVWLVMLEISLALVSCGVLVRAALRAPTGMSRASLLSLLGFLLVFQGLTLYLRRGRWRSPTLRPADLLQLTARRARTGIWLVWVNLAALVPAGVLSLPLAMGTRDRVDRASLAWPGLVALGVTLLAMAAFSVWYIRRQRRTLRRVRELSDQLEA